MIITLPKLKRVLFVCTENYCRSPTAEVLFKDMPGVWARSAGISAGATVVVSESLLAWADLVICFERMHKDFMAKRYSVSPDKITNVNIPDEYAFMDPELCDQIKASCTRHIEELA